MATWQGALVRVDAAQDFTAVARKHRVVLSDASGPWVLIESAPQLGRLGPPAFAQGLSKDLDSSVVAFFLQTTVSNERIEHWESGKLVRALEYYLDGGGWIEKKGSPQAWEPDYFFSNSEGTREGETWPSNLGDEISDEDIARFEQARKAKDPWQVMDLLMGGSIPRLCKFFHVDPSRPGGRYEPPPNWRPRLIGIAIVGVFVLAIAAAVMTSR